MLLKAGVLSLSLLIASRLLGLLRESAQAAAFGASGLADVAVLMLTLPDWLTGVMASGALAYVLVPAWAGQAQAPVAQSQRRVARRLLALGLVVALVWLALREPLVGWLAAGLPVALVPAAAQGLAWSAAAFPLALLAALWATRLQHERDFIGLYAANLVVNLALVGAIALAGWQLASGGAVALLGAGLVLAMALRLAWQAKRLPRAPSSTAPIPAAAAAALPVPAAGLWAWAVLSAGLPLALPFLARSLASMQGEGGLAVFNYAWKLVELPLVLAIQLVATLALPAVAGAVRQGLAQDSARQPVRVAFALAFALACACAAGLLVGSEALARLLFGWGRMAPSALALVAEWGRVAAWGLPPQAIAAVALTVLASQGRLRPAALVYAVAVATLAGMTAIGLRNGADLMAALNAVLAFVAVTLLVALGPQALRCLPGWAMAWPLGALLVVAAALRAAGGAGGLPPAAGLTLAVLAALFVMAAAWRGAGPMRQALRR